MKKLDKLVLHSFIGPFVLTFLVVVFILLMQFLILYFDELAGKGLGIKLYVQLLFYFGFNMTPLACPLATLLAALITFGNLGEHFELTALKSAGISLLRAIQPLFIFVIMLSFGIFLSNSYLIPKTNLKAYSLLYDLRNKKPALNIKQGIFYQGIPGYNIKVNKKLADNKTLQDVIIYNHTKGLGNTDVIIAHSGKMYTIDHGQYLVIELFEGNQYSEELSENSKTKIPKLYRTKFEANKVTLDLSSFQLHRTKEELFSENKSMKTIGRLTQDIDTIQTALIKTKEKGIKAFFNHLPAIDSAILKNEALQQQKSFIAHLNDTINMSNYKAQINLRDTSENKNPMYLGMLLNNKNMPIKHASFSSSYLAKTTHEALEKTKGLQNLLATHIKESNELQKKITGYVIEKYKKLSLAVSCLVLLLIGAPLGAIIKKGGIGIPVLISIGFFVIYYIMMMVGEDWAKANIISTVMGIWLPNIALLPIGIFFLIQAKRDARLLESDFYLALLKSVKKYFIKKYKIFKVFCY